MNKKEINNKLDNISTKALLCKVQVDKQRKELIADMRQLVEVLGREVFDIVDRAFVFKLNNYSSDITFNRIYKICEQIKKYRGCC